VVALKAPVDAVPLVALLPLQPPDAVQEVAWVVDQVSVEAAPCATLVGFAPSVTVGEDAPAVTVTVTPATAGVVPAAPAQVKV
jgi:hypothetical protein